MIVNADDVLLGGLERTLSDLDRYEREALKTLQEAQENLDRERARRERKVQGLKRLLGLMPSGLMIQAGQVLVYLEGDEIKVIPAQQETAQPQ